MSELYKRDLYLNKSNSFLVSKTIIEYDISSAGYNISKLYKLLTPKQEAKLDKLSKKDRHYQIGWYQRHDREYAKRLKDAFVDIRRRFFEANDIQDQDVLSIKKDAIFMLRSVDKTKFDNVEFKEKNFYTTFIHLDRSISPKNIDLELYYDSMKGVDVKGIDDDKVFLH